MLRRNRVRRIGGQEQERHLRGSERMGDREDPLVLDVHIEDRAIDHIVDDRGERGRHGGRRQHRLAASVREDRREVGGEHDIVFDDEDRSTSEGLVHAFTEGWWSARKMQIALL